MFSLGSCTWEIDDGDKANVRRAAQPCRGRVALREPCNPLKKSLLAWQAAGAGDVRRAQREVNRGMKGAEFMTDEKVVQEKIVRDE